MVSNCILVRIESVSGLYFVLTLELFRHHEKTEWKEQISERRPNSDIDPIVVDVSKFYDRDNFPLNWEPCATELLINGSA